MNTHTMYPIHTNHKGQDYTYLIFGPYSQGEFDVEVHEGHVNDNLSDTYMFTESDLPSDANVVADMVAPLEDYLLGYSLA